MAPPDGLRMLGTWMARILGPESKFIGLALVYGAAISLLSLATPISVQLLINSVANTALPTPLFTLSGILFGLLLMAGTLSALRVHLMALFERKLFARLMAEITLRSVHAQNPFFLDVRRSDLFNRFFDLLTVQKALPSLLIGGFSILLQGVIGIVITSFYHPFFLAFNACLVIVLVTLWWVWAPGAVRTAIAKSHAKHAAAAWLESIGASNGAYKSSRHLTYAIERSENATANYVSLHKDHFRFTFRQTLCLLLLYATASAALLALGGWLILINELSVGQLVAAELILSSVLYGVAQLGGYLENFYDLVAGLEELSLFWDLPQEPVPIAVGRGPLDGAFRFRDISFEGHLLDFAVSAGEQLAVIAEPGTERSVTMLLRRLSVPERGLISIGGADIAAFDMYQLRSAVMVLDGSSNVEMTAREYLTLACPEDHQGIIEAMELVGLGDRVGRLPKGLDTTLSASGWPLSVQETLALKLAGALLAQPRVLILSSLYDLMPPARVDKVLSRLKHCGTTVLQFTSRPEGLERAGWLWLGTRRQHRAGSLAELGRLLGQEKTDALSA